MRIDTHTSNPSAAAAFDYAHSEDYTVEPDPSDAAGINDPLPTWVEPCTLAEFAAEVTALRSIMGF